MPCQILIKIEDHFFFLWSYSNNCLNWEWSTTGKANQLFSLKLKLDQKGIISSKENVSSKIYCVDLFEKFLIHLYFAMCIIFDNLEVLIVSMIIRNDTCMGFAGETKKSIKSSVASEKMFKYFKSLVLKIPCFKEGCWYVVNGVKIL